VALLHIACLEEDASLVNGVQAQRLQTQGVADNVLTALPKSAGFQHGIRRAWRRTSQVTGSIALFTLALLNRDETACEGAVSGKREAVVTVEIILAKAAACPVLEVVGVPPFVATIASVLFATIPYEIRSLDRGATTKDIRRKMKCCRNFGRLNSEEQARKSANLP
jgi:hypothetical protein